MRIALATCAQFPAGGPDDEGYISALRARGVTVTTPIWNDAAAAAAGAFDVDMVISRSTWDYALDHAGYLAWSARVDAKSRLMNPASIVRWNSDKALYLKELGGQGVPIIPTVWGTGGATDVPAAIQERGWSSVVVKPTVGGGSRNTEAFRGDDAGARASAFASDVLKGTSLMIQPLLPRISDGEVSLLYFAGRYSHAVIKKPKAGDFRSQPLFGSTVTPHVPTQAERALADAALDLAGGVTLYARCDLVTGLDGTPVVIELELIEPCLFFEGDTTAINAFADATLARLHERR